MSKQETKTIDHYDDDSGGTSKEDTGQERNQHMAFHRIEETTHKVEKECSQLN